MQSCGNPLFLQWVSEWMQEAKEKNLKSYNVFKIAYNSLLSCPITFSDPSQVKKLKGIGNIISTRLEKRLKEYQRTNIDYNIQHEANIKDSFSSQLESHSNTETIQKSFQQKAKAQSSKTYIPGYRSKSFAILVALFKFNEDTAVSKEEILNIARYYYDIGDHKNVHSLWNGMKILLEKEYVYKTVNPTRYYLTDLGKEIAVAISSSVSSNKIIENDSLLNNEFKKNKKEIEEINYHEIHVIKEIDQNIEMKKKVLKEIPKSPIHNTILNISKIQHNSYSITLLLDTREMKTQKDKEFIEYYLTKESIVFEFRTLELGDVIWVARCNTTKKEYMLDFIIERKRLNDLASSIKDGRFHEQKFRLSKSCLKHVIYIIENCDYDFTDFNIEAIHSAISSTQIINGFFVKRLSGLIETFKYIVRLTRYISQIYKTQDLYIIDNDINLQTYTLQKKMINSTYPERSYVIEYNTFSDFLSKTASLTLGDLFLKMLLTIKGVSPEKAIEIQKHFPTLNDLLTSYYKETSEYEREIMIAKKCTNYGRKSISPLLSSKIYKVFK